MDKNAAKQVAERYLNWEDERKKHPIPRGVPIGVIGERVIVRQLPDQSKSRVIHLPQDARERSSQGVIIAAGEQAAKRLWARGIERGDWIWYGKHAGVWEEWEHWIDGGEDGCDHDFEWINADVKDTRARFCTRCKGTLVNEEILVMNEKDVFGSIDLAVRIERGEVRRKLVDAIGSEPYFALMRKGDDFDIKAETSWDL